MIKSFLLLSLHMRYLGLKINMDQGSMDKFLKEAVYLNQMVQIA